MNPVTLTLEFMQCPVHPEYTAISVNTPGLGGTRLTPRKCCGQWVARKTWEVTDADLIRAIKKEAQCARRILKAGAMAKGEAQP